MQIIMDKREPALMMELLPKGHFEPVLEMLPAGDYIVPDAKMVWSWKSDSDFLRSIYSGHLKNEIAAMLSMGPEYFVGLIVWRDNEEDLEKVEAMVERYNALYLPTWFIGDRLQGIEIMYKWALKGLDDDFPLQIKRSVIISDEIDFVTERVLGSIRDIGPIVAKEIGKKYPTIASLVIKIMITHNYDSFIWKSKKEWQENVWYAEISGVGPERAERIKEALLDGKENK